MSHQIHSTRALIVGSESFAEANRWYFLFTPDLGLIRGRAQGVRLIQSKLRSQLLLFDEAAVSLVRGRDGWHLVGAESTGRVRPNLRLPAKRELVAKVSRLLLRLLAGEEANPDLFTGVLSGLHYLAAHDLSSSGLYQYELIMVLRILANLGYVSTEREFERLTGFEVGWSEVLESAKLPESELLATINSALRHSQL